MLVIEKPGSISITTSFIGGVAAGALAIVISLIVRSFAGGPFIPELASQTLFSLTSGQFESQAVANFGPLAKYSAFAGAIIANFILYGLFAVWVDRLNNRFQSKRYVGKAILSSAVAYVILLILAFSLVTITETRSHTQPTSIIRLIPFLILPQIAFGFTLSSFYPQNRRSSRKSVVENHGRQRQRLIIRKELFFEQL